MSAPGGFSCKSIVLHPTILLILSVIPHPFSLYSLAAFLSIKPVCHKMVQFISSPHHGVTKEMPGVHVRILLFMSDCVVSSYRAACFMWFLCRPCHSKHSPTVSSFCCLQMLLELFGNCPELASSHRDGLNKVTCSKMFGWRCFYSSALVSFPRKQFFAYGSSVGRARESW